MALSRRILACLPALLLAWQIAPAQTFTDRWSSSGFTNRESTQGVALGDYNGDGAPDIFTTSMEIDVPIIGKRGGPDRCYSNDGSAFFTDRAPQLGLDDAGQGLGPAWADYDNDGLLDLYVVHGLQELVPESHVLFHQVAGAFDSSPKSYFSAAEAGRSACWADYDNDGNVDLFVTNGMDSSDILPDARIFLFRNMGDGSFVDMTVLTGLADTRNGHGCAWSDFDNDGDQDLYIANHGFEVPFIGIQDPQPNALYKNLLKETGVASFVDVADAAGVTGIDLVDSSGAAFGCSWADFNNDGWMDLYVTNGFSGGVSFLTPNRLYLNNRNGTFTDVTVVQFLVALTYSSSFGCTWADFNNDGYLDLYVNNANIPLLAEADNDLFISGGWPLYMFDNKAADANVEVQEWAQANASADFNGDGYVDIYSVNGILGGEFIFEDNDNLFMNDGGSNHWLHLDLVGVYSNRSAIGARVTLKTFLRSQTREVSAGSGYQSMDDLRVEFGLGSDTKANEIEIRWPSGCVQTLNDVSADQVVEVVEACSEFILRETLQNPVANMYPLRTYEPAPASPPWMDPQAVLNDTQSFFYQHSLGYTIYLSKAGATVAAQW